MATTQMSTACPKASCGSSESRSSQNHQWHFVDCQNWCTYSPSGIQERRDLPECYGAWATVSGRFYRWCKQGLWQQILQKLQQLADAKGQLDWALPNFW